MNQVHLRMRYIAGHYSQFSDVRVVETWLKRHTSVSEVLNAHIGMYSGVSIEKIELDRDSLTDFLKETIEDPTIMERISDYGLIGNGLPVIVSARWKDIEIVALEETPYPGSRPDDPQPPPADHPAFKTGGIVPASAEDRARQAFIDSVVQGAIQNTLESMNLLPPEEFVSPKLRALAPARTSAAECEECWGTGYWKGFGAPCAKGCKP